MKKIAFLLMLLVFAAVFSVSTFAGVEPSPFSDSPVSIQNPVIEIPVMFIPVRF